jgi:hypothetical protein
MMNRRALMKGMAAMTMVAGVSSEGEAQANDETVYELRIYHLNEGKQAAILDRFRTKERAIFARLGMHGVAYWVPTDEPLAGRTLVYMLRHRSRAAADAAWAKFRSDPEWVALKKESERDGEFVNKHDITFLRLTDFSPKV